MKMVLLMHHIIKKKLGWNALVMLSICSFGDLKKACIENY